VLSSKSQLYSRINSVAVHGEGPRVLGKAVILGGSIAGLLAARILSDHAESVVIIEKDYAPADDYKRRGAPHGGQFHILLPVGLAQMERWFPGLASHAVARGATMSLPRHTTQYRGGVRGANRGGGPGILLCSRPFLESLLRERVSALPNVTAVTAKAAGLVIAGGTVTGVRCVGQRGEYTDDAEFVVDAMGRSSRMASWLAESGWPQPPVRRIRAGIRYSTAFFHRSETRPGISLVVNRNSDGGTDAGVAAVERGRWMVLTADNGAQAAAPSSPPDFVARIRKLPPEFHSAIGGDLVTEIMTFYYADSRRRDFHLLRRFPARLLSVGDAVASVNPIYGLGMTCAALHASCLSEYLRSAPDLNVPAFSFLQAQRVVVDAAWQVSTTIGADRRHPLSALLARQLTRQIAIAALTDPLTSQRLSSVTSMRAHPNSLMTPSTLGRAIAVNASRCARKLIRPES
jgi:2-polyprenyl-6-methoxyphenol hydroxylase-like FAD-dependent oxidoreductase